MFVRLIFALFLTLKNTLLYLILPNLATPISLLLLKPGSLLPLPLLNPSMPLLLVSLPSAAHALRQPLTKISHCRRRYCFCHSWTHATLLTLTHSFKSCEMSPVTLKLFSSNLTVFNVYRPPPATTKTRKPVSFSDFLSDLDTLLSLAATIPHEFLITGDFNLHLDNPDMILKSNNFSLHLICH